MATLTIPINLVWSGASGSPGVNVWHGRTTGALPNNDDLASLTGYLEDFYASIAAFYPNTVTISWAGEANGVGDDVGSYFDSPAWSVQGTGGTAFLPPADCMLVSWRAATGGRKGKGRTFIGPLNNGIPEANGTPGESARSALQAAADALIESSDSFANGALGVYSRADSTFRDFVTAEVPNYFAVLRSRRD